MKRKVVRSRQAGFTLIELMMTLTIIALLASTLVYNWRTLKEKALLVQGQQAAQCLQSALIGLDAWTAENQEQTIHKLGGTESEFYTVAEDLGCRLGPTTASPNSSQVLIPIECKVVICQRGVPQRFENCSSFDVSTLSPFEEVCMELRFAVPRVSRKMIVMNSEEPIRVEPVLTP